MDGLSEKTKSNARFSSPTIAGEIALTSSADVTLDVCWASHQNDEVRAVVLFEPRMGSLKLASCTMDETSTNGYGARLGRAARGQRLFLLKRGHLNSSALATTCNRQR